MKKASALLLLAVVTCPLGARAQSTVRPDADPRVEALVASVSEERLAKIVETLAGFRTRNTLSDTTSPTRGIGAARQWIFNELSASSPKLQVSFETFHLAQQGRITRPVELRNVIAVLPGRSPRRIYITAHYDTVNIGSGGQIGANTRAPGTTTPPDVQLRADQDYNVDAPGANDNGSGSALTIELARVFAASGLDFDATIVFALWAGEEQGLVGSRAHAAALVKNKTPVDADFNNDIVGNSRGGNGVVDAESVRLYSEGPEDSLSRSLARYTARVAALYVPSHHVRLLARPDRFSRGSDHSGFTQHGFPAVAFRESNENFSKQHEATDTVDGVDFRYLAQNTRVNAAGVASLALAPAAPVVVAGERALATIGRQPSGYDANLRWTRAAGAVAYRIYWRTAWTNDWEHTQLVGDVTQFVLAGVSIDDFVFGVATVGPDGHESLVSAYVVAVRRDPEVKLLP
ncbi:MAG TPA: M20/M25/M40 family metallo-hydrolase [Vicinamibacterales bacterium]|nr:M20/M25/M40 family metallo-hydrolase [Vicinamibacterales bacterium]